MQIQLVVLDWAGTTVDHGCFAPVAAFMSAFKKHGIQVTAAHTRIPMGLHKKDHIRAMLQMPENTAAWMEAHQRAWTEADVESIFQAFIPMQLEVLPEHSKLIPGLLESVAWLRNQKIAIAGTTGYFREAAQRVAAAAAKQGYQPDINNSPEDVSAGRPMPWMIYRSMEKLGIYPPASVLKIGDTIPDIEEGRNAGCWSYGVIETSSEVGCTEAEFQALSAVEKQQKCAHAETVLSNAGAHGVITSVRDLPQLIQTLNEKLSRGERP